MIAASLARTLAARRIHYGWLMLSLLTHRRVSTVLAWRLRWCR